MNQTADRRKTSGNVINMIEFRLLCSSRTATTPYTPKPSTGSGFFSSQVSSVGEPASIAFFDRRVIR
jgi:hypothetical protein